MANLRTRNVLYFKQVSSYEDKLGRLWNCKNIDELIAESRENFEANGYTEEEMRNMLPMIFGMPPPAH